MNTTFRNGWICLFMGFGSVGWAQELAPIDRNYAAHVQETARQLEGDLQRLQEAIIARYEGRDERRLFRQTEEALRALQQFARTVQPGVGRQRVYDEFAVADKQLHEVQHAIKALGPDGQAISWAAERVDRADHQVHAAVFRADDNEGRNREVIERQSRALAGEARELYRSARYALDDKGPRWEPIERGLKQLADAADNFARNQEQAFDRNRLQREFAPLNQAWERLHPHLRALPARDARVLLERAERVDDHMEQIHARLGAPGERPRFARFDLLAAIAEGKTFEIIARHNGRCLDVPNGSRDNGEPLHQWRRLGVPNQHWKFIAVEEGWVKIVNVHSGKCVQVEEDVRENGARVFQWADTGHPSQLWGLAPVGGGAYKIINRGSGKCLDVAHAVQHDGGQIQQWDYLGAPNQQWRLTPID